MSDDGEGGADADTTVAPPPQPKVSSTKARAEARRRRILASSRSRLGVVSGEGDPSTVVPAQDSSSSPAEEAAADAPAAETGADVVEVDNDGEGKQAGTQETGASSRSGSARLAAMRRRRFKKASAAAAEDKEENEAGVSKEDPPQQAEEGGGEAEEEADETMAEATAEDRDTVVDVADNEEEGGGAKKKYMGVAKMRRMRLIEQKKKREKEEGTKREGSARAPNVDASSGSVVPRPSAVRVLNRAPTALHLLTTLAIFASGLMLGVRNSPATVGSVNYGATITPAGLTPLEEGLGILGLVGLGGGGGETGAAGRYDARAAILGHIGDGDSILGEEDEFGEPVGADGGRQPNIDPLFQLDLDELTAGPGILNSIARVAISCHRFLSWFFLFLPLGIFRAIFALPMSLLSSPPLLFISAVLIRAFGRSILGAKLPDSDLASGGCGDKGAEEAEVSKDILDLAKNYVKGMILRAFPTAAVSAYVVLREAWSDIYLALCGLLVGLAVPTQIYSGGSGTRVIGGAGGEL